MNASVQLTKADAFGDALVAGRWLAVADGGVGAARAKGTSRRVMIWDPSMFVGVPND